jgi:hypothetical protein
MDMDPASLVLPRAANLYEDLTDDIEEPSLPIDMPKTKKSIKRKVKEKDVRVSVRRSSRIKKQNI